MWSQFNDDAGKWRYHALTQGIRTIKLSPSTKMNSGVNKFTTKHQKLCQYLRALWQNKKTISQINHRYLESVTHILSIFQSFVVVKLKLMRKSSDFLLSDVTNIILVLKFMESNKSIE